MMTPTSKRLVDQKLYLAKVGEAWVKTDYGKHERIFSQGDGADAIFYIQNGKVKLTLVSQDGKEAVIALPGNGDFFGEG
jgi:CRP/FNR family transcriptional regulator, cyclic AMP receptor protein